ncbi:NAD(P)H-binding protein [Kribbella sp. NPDC051770]|uniref:NAD(P)H-binding protein n=1 Tax=Kribbella sp. NPDC051770 TaxID=3155413 RepID=UPI0034412F8A
MRVVIAGGHGQIALRLTKLLAGGGHEVVGLVRNPAHETDVAAAGGQVAVLDLEQADAGSVAKVLSGADVAIFAAGAGAGSGNARKDTVDRGAAALFADHTGAGKVTRDDVAAVLAGLCETPAAIGRTLELIAGDTPVADALHQL